MIEIPDEPTPGVNLVGFLEAESGLGEIARKLGRGLERAGIPFSAIPYRRTASRQEHPLEFDVSGSAVHDVNLICLNADELPTFADDVGVELFVRRSSIGIWFWETNVFRREDRRAFLFLDEVWAPSGYVRAAVEREADVPVVVAPIPIEAPRPPAHSRAELGLPSGFVFLFLFDFVSLERKNPFAVAEAFSRAFAPGEGPTLVLKSINGQERKPHQLEQLHAAAAGRSDILVLDGYVSTTERDAFVAACDCFVSLHRSEGFGLTMAEAMSHGKPVIATGYSGNLEFMDESVAHLVPYELVPVPEDWWAHAPGALWAEPDVDAAAAHMQDVFAAQDKASALGEHARSEILARFTVERAADFVESRYRAIRDETGSHASADFRARVLRAAMAARKGADRGVSAELGRGPVGLLQRLVGRAVWPYLEERHRFETEVVDALARLQRPRHSSDLESR
jgi:glycosyltransferase involved in cell wall biosynthesis